MRNQTKMKYKLGNKGFIKMVHLLLIVLISLIVIPFAQPFIRYYSLSWHTDFMIKANPGNPMIIRKEIMSYAEKKRIPLLGKNLTVSRERRKVKVQIYWTDAIDYFGYYQKPLAFIINDEY